MDANFWLIQTFNGVSYGALLFLLASGLTLIFGVMRIVNLSHGAYFLLGGYVAITVMRASGWMPASMAGASPVASRSRTRGSGSTPPSPCASPARARDEPLAARISGSGPRPYGLGECGRPRGWP